MHSLLVYPVYVPQFATLVFSKVLLQCCISRSCSKYFLGS